MFSFSFVTEHTACEVVRWGLLYYLVEVLMTGRFDKHLLCISHYSALALMYFTEQCNWADICAVITMLSQNSLKEKMADIYRPVFIIHAL